MTYDRHIILSPLFATTVCGALVASAADDDLVQTDAPVVGRKIQIAAVQFDRWVYGTNAETARSAIDKQLDQKLRDIRKQFTLTDDGLQRLKLAARYDKHRYFRRIDDLRLQFDAVNGQISMVELNQFAQQAMRLQKERQILFDGDSFFAKAAARILIDKLTPTSKQASVQIEEISLQPMRPRSAVHSQPNAAEHQQPADAFVPENGGTR